MPPALRRRGWLVATVTLALVTTACSGALPESVKKGSAVAVGWTGTLTSTNAASTAGATPGNLDIASLTRGRFANVVEGVATTDKGFGTAKIIDKSPFTVRYDLAKPTWSDGTPVDTADLMLAWAASSDYFSTTGAKQAGTTVSFDGVPSELSKSAKIPSVDQGNRSIDVRFTQPVTDWKTALDVAVPAHVVGQRALGIKDPMEAKQAVETAIDKGDGRALAKIAKVWNTAFTGVTQGAPADALLSDGPYQVEKIANDTDGQHVQLVVNHAYSGRGKPTYQRIRLTPVKPQFALDKLGQGADVVQIAPTADNWQRVEYLKRRDLGVVNTNDGTVWAIVLRPGKGPFARPAARTAYIQAIPRDNLTKAGGGSWAEAYEATDSVLFPPGGENYEVDTEDSGFGAKFKSSGDGQKARTAAGVHTGATVCLAYDKTSVFAVNVFNAIQTATAQAGWSTTDCGANGAAAATAGHGWNAVLTRIPVPQTPADVAAAWGTGGARNLTGVGDPQRDKLIAQLARESDRYDARDVRVQVEKNLVADAVVLPIAVNPVVTISEKDVDNVQPQSGPVAPLLSTAVDWTPVKN